MRESDPGVPEALPRLLTELAGRLSPGTIDRLWLFPPRRRGRKEWGLVVASAFVDRDDRRRVLTARYTAERTGRGLTFERDFAEEGSLPPDRFRRLVAGVVRRTEEDLGDPRPVEIDGDPARFRELVAEFEPPVSERPETLKS